MSDLISRQDFMEQLHELCNKQCPHNEPTKAIGACCAFCIIDDVIRIVRDLPSAEPRCIANIHLSQEQLDEAFEKVKADILSVKPKTGKWKEVKNADGASHDYRCSVCHRYRFHNGEMRSKYKYCPNCGCRMVEQRESEDKE